jgi:hypothetical protein
VRYRAADFGGDGNGDPQLSRTPSESSRNDLQGDFVMNKQNPAPVDFGRQLGLMDKRRTVVGDVGMYDLLKSTVLGAVLLTGMALAAQAQSVSASPPAGGAPQRR